jgi:hypothetical protein
MDINRAIITLVPFAYILGIGLFVGRSKSSPDGMATPVKNKTIFWGLVSWTMLGFTSNLDYYTQSGCVVSEVSMFSTANISFSIIALALLTIGYFIPYRRLGIVVLTFELIIWVFKFLLIKEGYAVGYGGEIDMDVLFFDVVALTLRLVLIKRMTSFRFGTLYVLAPAVLIILTRTAF